MVKRGVKIRDRKTHININIFGGLSQDWVGGFCLYVFSGGILCG